MIKLNNKGFAMSGILYSALILFIAILIAMLSLLSSQRILYKKTYEEAEKKLTNFIPEYRMIARSDACGQPGTGNDSVECGDYIFDWTAYYFDGVQKHIFAEEYAINKIKNQGSASSKLNIDLTNVMTGAETGNAYFKFNGTSSIGTATLEATDPLKDSEYKTIYLELHPLRCNATLLSFNNNNNFNISLSGTVTNICNKLTITDGTKKTEFNNLTITNNSLSKLILSYNTVTNAYDLYYNGVLATGTPVSTHMPYLKFLSFKIGSGSTFYQGNINNIRLSTADISAYEALLLTSLERGYDIEMKLNKNNTEIIYAPIQFR